MKDEVIQKRNHPAMYLQADLRTYDLASLGKFDVIMMDPPWEEYYNRVQGLPIFIDSEKMAPWTFDEIANLPIDQIAAVPSFIFLWVGSEGLDLGRALFRKWGFKRCEDIVWVKTNKESKDPKLDYKLGLQGQGILQRIKEHCLVGLKGDVRRASDSYFIHANIDTDVIVDEEPPMCSTKKPTEIYQIIERFCLGRKRLELFGENHNIRPGWLTLGNNLFSSNYDAELYNSWFVGDYGYPFIQDHRGGRYIGTTPDIENIRPKSPKSSYNVDEMGNKISPSVNHIPQQNLSGMMNEDVYSTPMSYTG
jgi:mRNA (2'-O-methyladenosine-N6-)-methyltransferase